MLDKVAFLFLGGAFARLHADHTFAATALRTKCAHGRALDKAAMRDADDAPLIRDKVFHIDLDSVRNDLRQTRRTVLVADIAQIVDGLDELLVFLVDLLALETGQLIQAEVENFVRLLFAERIPAIR